MASKAVAKKEETSLVSSAPSFITGREEARGVSTRAQDNLIPLIYVLQAQSPQAKKKDPSYIEGAEGGSIWLRDCRVPIVSGDEGIAFQPCYFDIDWVRWKKERGGFVARYSPGDDADPDVPPRGAVQVDNPNGNFPLYEMDGDDLVQTRYHYGIVYGGRYGLQDHPELVIPYCIPLSSTGHQVSKAWMFLMRQFMVNGKPVDSFSRFYHLKTVYKSNAKGDWFQFEVSDGGWVETQEQYQRGEALYESMHQGEMRAEAPEASVGETGADIPF